MGFFILERFVLGLGTFDIGHYYICDRNFPLAKDKYGQ